MSNQQRILAATQIQQDKKRDLRLLSRASTEHCSFDHEQERQITTKSHQQQLLQKESLLIKATQNQHKSSPNPERLIAAHNLQTLKHRQQSIVSRTVPQNNDELDITNYWWLTPSTHRIALKPFSKKLCPINSLL